MAFRGKPSSGCAKCRSRKLRCSGTITSCSQCFRLGWQCPGYRNQMDLLFCDQSKEIQSKDIIRENRRRKERQLELTKAKIAFSLLKSHECLNLDIPLDDYALAFFFQNYILNTDQTRSYNGYLPALHSRERVEGPLAESILSVGLASLSRVTLSRNLRVLARRKYGIALALTNTALCGLEAVDDEILAAVLLLGLYETITCDSQQSYQSWEHHMSGCLALIRLRGPGQFVSDTGMELFQQLRTQLIIGCIQRNQPVPKPIVEFTRIAHEVRGDDVVGSNKLAEISSEICQVRAFAQDGTDKSLEEMIQTCQRIDVDIVEWSLNLPPSTEYSSVNVTEDNESTWGHSYDLYPDLSSAYLWNAYRGARILVHELLLDYLRMADDGSKAGSDYHQSRAVIKEMTCQIFDSVPFHLGMHLEESSEAPAVGGLFAIWYLYLIASMDIAAGNMRDWSIQRLEEIGRKMGVQQAFAVAGVLRKRAIKQNQSVPVFDFRKSWDGHSNRSWEYEDVDSLLQEAGVIRLTQKKLRYINDMPSEPEWAD